MKFATLFAILATVTTAVTAKLDMRDVTDHLSNAQRLAQGLPLMPPVRHGHGHGTPTYGAHKGKPSGTSTKSCNSGSLQCCNSMTTVNDTTRSEIESRSGMLVARDVGVGQDCSPITALGLGGNSCNTQTVCCENNSFKGVIALGCTAINL